MKCCYSLHIIKRGTGIVITTALFFGMLDLFSYYGPEARDTEEKYVVIKSLLINPSKKISQDVPVEIFLPKEVKPKDIIDAMGLSISFDYQAEKYVAKKTFTLKPGESKTIKILVRDKWELPYQEIENFKKKSDDILKELQMTKNYDRATMLKDTIDVNFNMIEQLLNTKPLTPRDRIEQHRQVWELLTDIRSKTMIQEGLKADLEQFNPATIWGIVITVILSLTLLAALFLYLWYSITDNRRVKSKAGKEVEKTGQP